MNSQIIVVLLLISVAIAFIFWVRMHDRQMEDTHEGNESESEV